jgi:hypothetical protein
MMKNTKVRSDGRRLQLDAACISNGCGDYAELTLDQLRNWTVKKLIKVLDNADSPIHKVLSSQWGKDSADQTLDVRISYYDGGVIEPIEKEDVNRVFGQYYEPKSCRWMREDEKRGGEGRAACSRKHRSS